MDRNIDDMENALASLKEIEAVKTDLEKMMKGMDESHPDYANLKTTYAAAEKAHTHSSIVTSPNTFVCNVIPSPYFPLFYSNRLRYNSSVNFAESFRLPAKPIDRKNPCSSASPLLQSHQYPHLQTVTSQK